MNYDKIAKAIARDIFSAGDLVRQSGQSDNCQRIAFMGGKYPDAETELGGVSEEPLAGMISRSLKRLLPE